MNISFRHCKASAAAQALFLFVLLSAGCGPTIRTKLPLDAPMPMRLALLPADYSVDIPKERISLVQSSVLSELRNRNFIVADEKVVQSVCSSPSCPERTTLSKDYLIDGFVTLSINSFSKNSFLAGYYNLLTGSLSISDVNGKEVFALDHTESERGGILFNSGQIIQGIISQVNNVGDSAYKELSSQFAKTIVSYLPTATNSSSADAASDLSVTIQSATARWTSPSSYLVCITGSPHSLASVLIGTQKTSLREIKSGYYCGAFSPLVATSASNSSFVELRTAYGNSIRQPITLPSTHPCELNGRLQLAQPNVLVSCSIVGNDLSRIDSGCSPTLRACKATKIILYSADNGGYRRVTESKRSIIKLPDTRRAYQFVAIGAGNVPSTPVLFPNAMASTPE